MAYEPYGKKVQWDVQNSMDVLPDNAGLTFPWTKTTLGTVSGTVGNDNSAFNGRSFNISTSTTLTNNRLSYIHDTAGKPWYDYIDNALGWTIDFRMRIATEGSVEAFRIHIADGVYKEELIFTGTTIATRHGSFSTVTLSAGQYLTRSNMTWIRIIGKGSSIKIYLDGKLLVEGTQTNALASKWITWGDTENSANQGGSSFWDFVQYSTRGAFSPIDEWQSEWLFETDPTSLSLLQDLPKTQVNGTDTPTYAIEADSACLNGYRLRITTDPTKASQLSFGSDTRGILGGTNKLNSNSVGYTVEARAKVVSSGSAVCQSILVADGTYIFHVSLLGTRIEIDSAYISELTQTYDIANTAGAWNDYHTIRVYVKGTLIKVFVDNVLAITATLDNSSSVKEFFIGDNSTNTNWGGVCYWDYFRIHAQDAIDPTRMAHRWDVQYECERIPYNTREPWNTGEITLGSATATVQSDSDCINGKRIRFVVGSSEYYIFLGATNYNSSNRNDIFNNLVDNVKGWTAEIRVKMITVTSGYPLSFDFYAQDFYDQLWVSGTEIRTKLTGFSVTGLVLTDRYHILTMNYKGDIGRIFLDGILISQFTRVNVSESDLERFWFGCAGDGVGTVDYDYARYNTEGAFDPLGCKEDISVTENVSLAKEILEISVYEFSGLLITEHVDVVDLVVEVGVIDDFVNVLEVIVASLDILNLDVYEVIVSSDNRIMFMEEPIPNNVDSYSDVVVLESISIDPPYELIDLSVWDSATPTQGDDDVVDNVATSEYIDVDAPYEVISFFVYDEIDVRFDEGDMVDNLSIVENTQIEIGLPIDIYDSVSIAEYVEGEVIVVYQVNVFDEIDVKFDDTDMSDEVAILEEIVIQTQEDVLSIDIYDETLVEEIVLVDVLIDVNVSDDITIEENYDTYLDELYLSEYEDILTTESISIIDLIVELGVVNDDIVLSEDVVGSLDELFIDLYDDILAEEVIYVLIDSFHVIVDDEITIEESLGISLGILNIDQSEEITISEDVSNNLSVGIDIYEDISISEDATIEISTHINVSEEIFSIEDVTVSLDVLNFSEYEDIVTTEYISLIDLVVELGIVDDPIETSEYIEISLDELNISIYEEIVVSEDIYESITELNVSIFDTIESADFVFLIYEIIDLDIFEEVTIVEEAVINIGALNADAYEDIVSEENTEVSMDSWNVDLYESIEVSEYIAQSLDDLFLFTIDPFHVLITEHTDIVDLVVEVGVVMDAIPVGEYQDTYLDVLNLDLYESVTISEDIELLDMEIDTDVYDPIEISESIDLSIDELFISISQVIDVAEFIEIVDLIVELGIIYDEINTSENLSISLSELFLDLYDDILITEETIQSLPSLFVFSIDTISIIEFVEILDIDIDTESVWEDISIEEDLSVYLDSLNPEIYDSVLVEETEEAYPYDLYFDISDSSLIEESPLLYLDYLFLDVTKMVFIEESVLVSLDYLFEDVLDMVLVEEDMDLYLEELNVSLDDSITIDEMMDLYLDSLDLDIYDDIVITESISVIDLIVEVGIVDDVITAEEVIELSVDELGIVVETTITIEEYVELLDMEIDIETIYDSISISELAEPYLDNLFIDTYETITISEEISDSLDNLIIDQYEDILADEFPSLDIPMDVNIYDDISISEDISPVIDILMISNYEDISIAETSEISLDVLNVDIYDEAIVSEDVIVNIDSMFIDVYTDTLITESISVIDLIVEVGIVNDDISIVEDPLVYLDLLYLNVDDILSVAEYAEIVDSILKLESLYDDVAIAEYSDQLIDNLFLDYYDDIAIEENVSQFIDDLFVDTYEIVSVVEDIEILDTEIDPDLFIENIVVEEYVSINLGSLSLSVQDDILIEETIDILDLELDIEILYEDISITESISMHDLIIELGIVTDDIVIEEYIEPSLDQCFVSEYDSISIAEYVEILDLEIDIDVVFETISITDELISLYLDVIYVDVIDPFHVLITEHTDILDLGVEVGVVMDAIPVADEREISLDALFTFSIDNVIIDEQENISLDNLIVDTQEDIFLQENIEVFSMFVNIDTSYDDILIAEEVTIESMITFSVYDDITISEYSELLDIEIDLEVYDEIVIVESIETEGLAIRIDVFENVVMSESFLNYMPISFYVAEQKGMSIITISDW